MSFALAGRGRNAGDVNNGGANVRRQRRGLDSNYGSNHFMTGVDEMSVRWDEGITEKENQRDFNMMGCDRPYRKRRLTEVDQVDKDCSTISDPTMASNQHDLFMPGNLNTTGAQETEEVEPVEVRLLAALQQELGLPFETTPLKQPDLLPSTTNAPLYSREPKRVRLSKTSSDLPPASTVSVPVSSEYRNMFPPQDVANLQDHHWQFLKHIIPPRLLGLHGKNAELPHKEDRPSSVALDEMIGLLSGGTKLRCLEFREAQKSSWRKGQQRCRANARANKTSTTNPRLTQPKNAPSGVNRTQHHSHHQTVLAQPSRYVPPRYNRGLNFQRENLFAQPVGRYSLQGPSPHPHARSNSHIPPRGTGTGERRMVPILAGPQNRLPVANGYGSAWRLRPSRPSMVPRPIYTLPDLRMLPRLTLPLSEEEKAYIRYWMTRRD